MGVLVADENSIDYDFEQSTFQKIFAYYNNVTLLWLQLLI